MCQSEESQLEEVNLSRHFTKIVALYWTPQKKLQEPLSRGMEELSLSNSRTAKLFTTVVRLQSLAPRPRINAITGKGPTRSDVYIIHGPSPFFENCLFLFSIETTPPKDGQSMTRELLAQTLPISRL